MTKMSDLNWDSIPVKMIIMSQPALGADFAIAETTVPAGKKWRFVAAYIIVDTSGAANWNPDFAIDDGNTIHRMWHDQDTITAGVVSSIHVGPYMLRVVTGVYQYMPMFLGCDMNAGYRFRVAGATADDRWAASYFFYKEVPA